MPWLSSASPLAARDDRFPKRVEEMSRRNINGDDHVAAGLEAAGEHGIDDDLRVRARCPQLRTIPPLIADQCRFHPPLGQHRADRAIHGHNHLQGLAVALAADGMISMSWMSRLWPACKPPRSC